MPDFLSKSFIVYDPTNYWPKYCLRIHSYLSVTGENVFHPRVRLYLMKRFLISMIWNRVWYYPIGLLFAFWIFHTQSVRPPSHRPRSLQSRVIFSCHPVYVTPSASTNRMCCTPRCHCTTRRPGFAESVKCYCTGPHWLFDRNFPLLSSGQIV